MKKTLLPLLLLLITHCSPFAQGINNLWLMGYQSWAGPPFGGINMDFTGGVLNISYVSRPVNFNATSGVICDSNGSLLFCSNGLNVYNSPFDTMLNGEGLNPGPWTTSRDSFGLSLPQANIIIPMPNDPDKYYLFHETTDDYGNTYAALRLYKTIIDMSLDSGRGAVIQKNVVLLYDTLVDHRLTACRHGNGRDWWLIAHQYNTNKYYKWLITPDSLSGPFSQNIGSTWTSYFGQSVFSPDGNQYATYEPILQDLDILSFDRCTGMFSNLIHVPIFDSAYSGGVAFSPNSKVLYVSSQRFIYQFDMNATNISASQTTVAVWDTFFSPNPPLATVFYLAQLAPDDKIYINCSNGTQYMHVINYPDSLGISCSVWQDSIHLPAYNALTIPNHPNYFLGALTGSICDTLTSVNELATEQKEVNLFPNPASHLVYLHRPGVFNLKKTQVQVFNAMGQLMEVPFSLLKNEYFELNVSRLPAGVYFVELLTDREKVVKRFLKL